MNLLSIIATAVFAAENIISPLPDNFSLSEYQIINLKTDNISENRMYFGSLIGESNKSLTNNVLSAEEDINNSSDTKKINSEENGTDHKIKSTSVKIAVLGDSMVDTLGPGLPSLKSIMQKLYPGVDFYLFNYGVGATNIDYGLERIVNGYNYLGKDIPSLISVSPDIVVIESFAYNPFPYEEGALDHHWLSLAKAVDEITFALPRAKIVIAVTVAPNSATFGDGAPGLAFSPQEKISHTATINKYLENTVKFAQSQHLPLADAYTLSLDSSGNGKPEYINPGDHIHYSDLGREFFSNIIAGTILSNNLIQ